MMPAKLVSLDLEIKIFWDKGYAIIIFVYDVTNKIYDVTQHFLDVVMWSKFGQCGISMMKLR